ncbi:sensor histidine kinase, partial [Thiolapillus sp.]
PSMLDDLGLLPTLRWLCREYQASFAHIKLDTDFDIDETTLSKDQINMIFRIVQEGMNNASKHAFANRLMVRLIAKAGETTLEIEDDGLGFDLKSEKIGEGFGLSSMRERAMLTGGSMTIDSMPGKGTRLRVAWKKTNEL